ncbi:hypothetical protein HZH66_008449 [Vespula vulgaris]|uniref:Uncharacterized protein n=1 Tax=Vespula vulgaris TaxID=7454 RepID=A0A834JQB4_VESVU|nr:hypothetical protein HZH66_008449 [Vespula vulgaris]
MRWWQQRQQQQQQQQHRGQVATRREPGNLGGTEFSRAKLPAAIGDIQNDSLAPMAGSTAASRHAAAAATRRRMSHPSREGKLLDNILARCNATIVETTTTKTTKIEVIVRIPSRLWATSYRNKTSINDSTPITNNPLQLPPTPPPAPPPPPPAVRS